MKLQGDYNSWSVSQSLLGKILSVSQQRVNQLIDEEIVCRDEVSKSGAVLLIDSLKNYYLSKNVAGDNVNFWKERGLHEKAKRELAELKLRERRGELYEAAVVERVMIEHLTNFRNKLLGVAAKLAPQLEGKARAEIYDLINAEIEDNLMDLAKNIESADLDEERAGVESVDVSGDKSDKEGDG